MLRLVVFPLYVYRQIRIIKYWFILISSRDSLMYSLYNLKSNNGVFTNSWTNNVHNLLRELGLPYMIDKSIVSRLDLNLIIHRIHDQYIQTWFSELDQSPKLITYRLNKTITNHIYLELITIIYELVSLDLDVHHINYLLKKEGIIILLVNLDYVNSVT